MGTEWKRLTMQNGAWVATVTALVAGALLWYERTDPRYVTARDVAEIDFAILERAVACGSLGATTEHTNGYYPSRRFFTVDSLIDMMGLENRFFDLRGGTNTLTGAGRFGVRSPIEYPDMVNAWEEEMSEKWWQSNIWDNALAFGYLPHMMSDNFYITTNMLTSYGRPLSAMRWTIAGGNHFVAPPISESPGVLEWRGASEYTNNFNDAWEQALDSLDAADLFDGDWEFTNHHVVSHYVYAIKIVSGDEVKIRMREQAVFLNAREWIPPATNLTAHQIGAFVCISPFFWHPAGITGSWEFAESRQVNIGLGTNVFRDVLFRWPGRIDTAQARNHPIVLSEYEYTEIIGWQSLSADTWDLGFIQNPVFLADWRFQCLTNYAYFWP